MCELNEICQVKQTCRTCTAVLKDTILIPIFETNISKEIPFKIIDELNLFNLNIKENDGLPQQICLNCISHLLKVYQFHELCKKSQVVLSEYFKNIFCKHDNTIIHDNNDTAPVIVNNVFNEREQNQEHQVLSQDKNVLQSTENLPETMKSKAIMCMDPYTGEIHIINGCDVISSSGEINNIKNTSNGSDSDIENGILDKNNCILEKYLPQDINPTNNIKEFNSNETNNFLDFTHTSTNNVNNINSIINNGIDYNAEKFINHEFQNNVQNNGEYIDPAELEELLQSIEMSGASEIYQTPNSNNNSSNNINDNHNNSSSNSNNNCIIDSINNNWDLNKCSIQQQQNQVIHDNFNELSPLLNETDPNLLKASLPIENDKYFEQEIITYNNCDLDKSLSQQSIGYGNYSEVDELVSSIDMNPLNQNFFQTNEIIVENEQINTINNKVNNAIFRDECPMSNEQQFIINSIPSNNNSFTENLTQINLEKNNTQNKCISEQNSLYWPNNENQSNIMSNNKIISLPQQFLTTQNDQIQKISKNNEAIKINTKKTFLQEFKDSLTKLESSNETNKNLFSNQFISNMSIMNKDLVINIKKSKSYHQKKKSHNEIKNINEKEDNTSSVQSLNINNSELNNTRSIEDELDELKNKSFIPVAVHQLNTSLNNNNNSNKNSNNNNKSNSNKKTFLQEFQNALPLLGTFPTKISAAAKESLVNKIEITSNILIVKENENTEKSPQDEKKLMNISSPVKNIKINKKILSKIKKCKKCNKYSYYKNIHKHQRKCNEKNKNDSNCTCFYCDKVFPKEDIIFEHIAQTHPINQPYLCCYCNTHFVNKKLHTFHMTRYHGAYDCDICNKSINNEYSLLKHKKLVHNEYECNICSKKFNIKGKYNKHMKTHDSKKPLKHFEDDHEAILNDEKQFNYDICKKTFNQSTSLDDHTKNHNEIKSFLCSTCGTSFSTKTALEDHMKLHDTNIACTRKIYNKVFSRKTLLYRHYQKIHKKSHINGKIINNKLVKFREINNIKNNSCNKCKKQFESQLLFEKHMRLHDTNRRYVCKICGYFYETCQILETHIKRAHLIYKTYTCQFCKKSFINMNQRDFHLKCHVDIGKPFKCQYCNKSFRTQYILRKHEIFHTRATQCYCSICGEIFSNYVSLKIHHKSHLIEEKEETERIMNQNIFRCNTEIGCMNLEENKKYVIEYYNVTMLR